MLRSFALNKNSIYAAKVGDGDWYRVPISMVSVFLKSGAAVKELPTGGAWRDFSRNDVPDAQGD